MPLQLERRFAAKQRLYVRRALQGYPLYFGVQVASARVGKFLLSTQRSDVAARDIRALEFYQGRGAERRNKLSTSPRMGVATGTDRSLILHFRRGKIHPATAQCVHYIITRDLKFRLLRRVVTAAADELPVVPEQLEAMKLQTTESVRERAAELTRRMLEFSGDREELGETITTALKLAPSRLDDADEMLDDVELVLSSWDRANSLEERLQEIASHPDVSHELVDRIQKRYLQVARSQIESGTLDIALNNLDVAEELMDALLRTG